MSKISAVAVLFAASIASGAQAQTATGNLGVQITITGGCVVQNVTSINFGTVNLLNVNIDNTGSFDVLCTTGLPYTVALNGGGGGSIAARRMISGASTVGYQLYSDPGRTVVWGETLNVDRVAGTGNGQPQLLTVYGRVPPQTTPAAATYTDTVTITVSY